MPKKRTPTTCSDNRLQLDKFKDAARELECDDDEQHFKERLGNLVKAKARPEKDGNKP